jgi:hypothetical protein
MILKIFHVILLIAIVQVNAYKVQGPTVEVFNYISNGQHVIKQVIVQKVVGPPRYWKRAVETVTPVTATPKLIGGWQLTSSENFEELMKEIGVGWWYRKLGMMTKPNVYFELNGEEWTFKTLSSVSTTILKFKMGTQIDETTADGRSVKSTFKWDGDVMVQRQTKTGGGELVAETRREVLLDGTMRTTIKAGDVTATRMYSRLVNR